MTFFFKKNYSFFNFFVRLSADYFEGKKKESNG
jgi:hypothetical protein